MAVNGIDPSGQPVTVNGHYMHPTSGNDAGTQSPQTGLHYMVGGSNPPPPAHLASAHLAAPTPEADLLAHLQTAPVSSPVFDNGGAPPAGFVADALGPNTLDGGAPPVVDTGANILDHGVDYVQLLGVADAGHDDMQALLDHLQQPTS